MFEKGALKGLIYGMIGTTILGGASGGLLNQAHGYQGENGRNADAVKGYQEFKGLQIFWGSFVPAVEKSAKQKGISSVDMMNQIVTLLESFVKSPKSSNAQVRNGTILLAFAKDYVEAGKGGNSNSISKQREESIKRQREEEQKKIQQQNLNKGDYNKQVNNGFNDIDDFEFTNNKPTQNTQNNQTITSQVLKEITRGQSSSNELYLELEFEKFVDEYMNVRGLSKQDATKEAEKAFAEIYSYVSKGDVEGTLSGYVRLRNKYNIQRSEVTGGHQSASATWLHRNGACNGKTNLANLMLVMGGININDISRIIVNSTHVRLSIKGFSRHFDSVSAGLGSLLWKRNTDGSSYNGGGSGSYEPTNTEENNYNNSNNNHEYQDNSGSSSNSDDGVVEFDFT